MQSRRGSLAEAFTNTTIGYVVAVCSQLVIYPIWGFHISHAENLVLAGIFTVISLIRSYLVRRYFNWRLHRV